MRILIVEDDTLLGDGMQIGLQHLGFAVDWVKDGVQGLHALTSESYAAVVLDLGLPRIDGISLLRRLRSEANDVPVLILTARDGKNDKLSGFEHGADDYVVKPVDLDELAARLRALIRRSGGRANALLSQGDVELDITARRARRGGVAIDLSGRELTILEILMENAGRVISRKQLEAAIYGWAEGVESNAIEVHIHHLRKKLGNDFVKTLRGIGYIIEKTP